MVYRKRRNAFGVPTLPINDDDSGQWQRGARSRFIGHQFQYAPDGQSTQRGGISSLCLGHSWPRWFWSQGPDRLYRTTRGRPCRFPARRFTPKTSHARRLLFRRRFCGALRRRRSAATIRQLSAARSVSEPGCTDHPPGWRRLDKCRSSAHHCDRNSKWIWYPDLQYAPSAPLRRERKRESDPDSRIFVCSGYELWTAKRLFGEPPQHASAFPHANRRERRGLLSGALCGGPEAGREGYIGNNGTRYRPHTAYFVAGSS